MNMETLAIELNEIINGASPQVYKVLSDLGKRIYFPSHGILSQSGEAKKLAKKYNATIGIALEHKQAMHLDSLMSQLPSQTANEALMYSPSSGNPTLRQAWLDKDLHDNPSLAKAGLSLPIVTNGLSHALSLVGDLFLDAGDKVVMADMNWDNYHLNFGVRRGADFVFFPFFQGNGFSLDGFQKALAGFQPGEKAFVILNFPNNPSGYTPTEAEGQAIADILKATAERGVLVVALVDDAYFGLFYGEDVMRESLFCKLCGLHPNLLAIKADAATKELYVWGLRLGFLTFSVCGCPNGHPVYKALEAKAAGLVRSVISNCSSLSQNLACKALANPSFYAERAQKAAVMQERALEVKRVLGDGRYDREFQPYPFNSGYFMCLKILSCSATVLRKYLLEHYGVGTIAVTETNLRVAFSCLEKDEIEGLFAHIAQACRDLSAQNS
jgi:aspartate/methionine/tyrosine aminotransferase